MSTNLVQRLEHLWAKMLGLVTLIDPDECDAVEQARLIIDQLRWRPSPAVLPADGDAVQFIPSSGRAVVGWYGELPGNDLVQLRGPRFIRGDQVAEIVIGSYVATAVRRWRPLHAASVEPEAAWWLASEVASITTGRIHAIASAVCQGKSWPQAIKYAEKIGAPVESEFIESKRAELTVRYNPTLENYQGPGVYRHYKGSLYDVEGLATHSESGERMVMYNSIVPVGGPQRFACALAMFNEAVEGKPRFEFRNAR